LVTRLLLRLKPPGGQQAQYTAAERASRGTDVAFWYNSPLRREARSMYHDEAMTSQSAGTEARTQRADSPSPTKASPKAPEKKPELEQAREQMETARRRMLQAAIAFCDGSISVGQLQAVRELLREQELRVVQLEGVAPNQKPFVDLRPVGAAAPVPALTNEPDDLTDDLEDRQQATGAGGVADDLQRMLVGLERKLDRLETDFQQGRVNAAQYRAIRRHYLEQRDVATRLREAHPESDRWKVVLEEGKTSFLMQLNEAVCHALALYDMAKRERFFVQGTMPPSTDEALALLRTFGPAGSDPSAGRILATQAEDGSALLLIPGEFTAALVAFSQQPPGWQVRALREVHRNFEAANRVPLARGDRRSLVFPDLSRFIRP
jgi:hypothetical protein